ncbi:MULTISPECIES: D-glycero-alpha-D-manno-heptose-1,7-bisphosphate 7-phosphatase [Comamonas]|jgi:D-glycero-D-manno-heptose 1,7-bisphosphate phosphatase|uniref:D-glycero-alpha-D-manno-heptose-1,7-bisphosphate 7-phosphatase n=1 Tax=Comamonas TaxID=283 RepID=UPI0025FD74C4|nr:MULTISPECIES: HAD-IIIA family hydrolase [Comamonas]MDR3066653.1 HAD-IIIA family hydrolase [Comamonas sp.]MEB5963410.1 HAD-IIIA family hydrolase [Comamonas testosteroni]
MKIAILDRDGTLNQWGAQGFIGRPDEWVAVPSALEAVSRLNRAGWHVVVATNQPGLGRGLFDVIELNAVHAKMHREMAAVGARVEAVFFCPHAPDEDCQCRKPGAALFEQIADRYGAEGHEIWAIGSGVEHLQAGQALGAHLVFVESTARPEFSGDADLPEGSERYPDLEAVVNRLLPLGGDEDAQPLDSAPAPH